jgi:hypothetical protein
VFCNLVRKDKVMVQVVSIEEAIQDVVCETFEEAHADVNAQSGLGMFTALRREFPQATIVTLSLSTLRGRCTIGANSPDFIVM